MLEKVSIIEKAIQTLDAGTFQKLCDEIVSKKYPNYSINCLGSQVGTDKTTKGTPDTFLYTTEGKFIFVEYTTKTGSSSELMQKIESDINKCFDEDKICVKLNQIEKVIYFHTSSNLSPGNINYLINKCLEKDVLFEINGINQIAADIINKYPWLSEKYLGLSVDTEQIFEYTEFIQKYNKNKTVAPLEKKFYFREQEQKNIMSAFEKDAIIIKGKAGIGKTRLALECAIKYAEENNYQLLCARNNNLPIFEDIKKIILPNEKYVIFVDDANSFEKKEIHHFLNLIEYDSEIKLVFTVRDSLYSQFSAECQKFCEPECITLDSFSDIQIKEIIKNNLEIANDDYLDQIIRISGGNIRLAYLAGKCALDNRNIESIRNAENLFEVYYDIFFNDNELKDDKIIKTLGIIAFNRVIDLKKMSDYEDLFSLVELNRTDFDESCKKLIQLEILDKSYEQYIKVSEQCLENYFLYIFLFKNKYVELSKIISSFFPKKTFLLVSSLNSIIPIFSSDVLEDYMKNEILKIWDKMIEGEFGYDFVKTFGLLNQSGTLSFLKKMITDSEVSTINLNNIDLANRNLFEHDKILELIRLFSETEKVEIIIDLLCKYVERNQQCFTDAYYLIEEAFLPNRYSYGGRYYKESTVLDVILRNCDVEIIQIFFVYISKLYLSFIYHPADQGRKNTIILSKVILQDTEDVLNFRKKIWKKLSILLDNETYKDKVIEVIEDYASSGWSEEICVDLLKNDFTYVKEIIQKICYYDWIKGIHIQRLINERMQHFEIDILPDEILDIDADKNELFDIFIGNDYSAEQHESKIKEYFEKNPTINFVDLIKTVDIFINRFSEKSWQINYNLIKFLDFLSDSQVCHFIESYIKYGQNFQTSTYRNISVFVLKLFSILDKASVYNFILEKDFEDKNLWLFSYYSDMPQEIIEERDCVDFLSFFSIDLQDDLLKNPINKNISFLERYWLFDKDIFVKVYSKILSQRNASKNSFFHYSASLFLSNIEPSKIYEYFEADFELFTKLYFFAHKKLSHMDYNNKYFYYFLQKSETFKFQFINFFLDELRNYRDIPSNYFELWNFDNSELIIKEIFEAIYLEYRKSYFPLTKLQKLFVIEKDEIDKQNSFLFDLIESKICDKEYMLFLFEIIKEFPIVRKQIFVIKILNLNISFDIFSEIKFNTSIEISHGSFVPNIKCKIDFWKQIESAVKKTADNIEHFEFISKKIALLNRSLEEELKRNYLDSIFL